MGLLSKLQDKGGFPSRLSAQVWALIAILFGLPAVALRFCCLSNPLMEPHPWRQAQTALTIYYFAKGQIEFLNYASPLNGELWNFTREFPLYQKIVSWFLASGVGLEIAARGVTLFFFFAGAVYYFAVVRRLATKPIALWAVLLYILVPFNIVYSRTCLIDFTAVFFMLGLVWHYLAAMDTAAAGFRRELGIGTALGILAGITKVPIWGAPAGILFLTVLFRLRSRALDRRRGLALLAGLASQVLITGFWCAFAQKSYATAGNGPGYAWLFGGWEPRLTLANYTQQLTWISRGVLHDWLVLPFLIGIAWPSGFEKTTRIMLAAALIPLLTFFNVASHHDYYLIASVPQLLFIAAVGLVTLGRLEGRLRSVGLTLVVLSAASRVPNLPYVLGNLWFDRTPEIQDAKRLHSLTTSEEVAYFDDRVGDWYLPLYSERLVALERWNRVDRLKPAVFGIKKRENLALLREYSRVFVQGDGNFFLYRVRDSAPFRFTPERDLAVSDDEAAAARKLPLDRDQLFDLCGKGAGVELVRIDPQAKELDVRAVDVEASIPFPVKRVLSLPRRSGWGCRFEVRASSGSGKS